MGTMIDEKRIKRWLKDGTINKSQAKKMLADSGKEENELKSNKFIAIAAIIGAVLIFIGFAWLIAKNWHQIPSFMKVFILVGSTSASFVSGVMLKQKDNEGVGRALITLGALLYVLSLFLISQMYNLATDMQHYAWLLLLAWTVVLMTAYFLDSKENLVVAMLMFFPWAILQYFSPISRTNIDSPGGPVFAVILIFLGSGALLFGLSNLHSSLKHKFTNVYRFWTVFYFLLIFYIISFQSFLPLLSEYSFEGKAFSAFLILFIILCFSGFIIGTFFAASRKPGLLKEIAGFIGILAVLLLLVLATKAGAGQIGACYLKSCYDFNTEPDCNAAPDPFICEWKNDPTQGYCDQPNCWEYQTEAKCNSVNPELGCNWKNDPTQGYCDQPNCWEYQTEAKCNSVNPELGCNWEEEHCDQKQTLTDKHYQICNEHNNKKESCVDQELCGWARSYGFWDTPEGLPTSIWLLWIVNNAAFIGFIVLMLWYGQRVGSTKIVNLATFAFIIEVITRYIGFWFDFTGYFAFSLLAIIGGLLLILGALFVPKWRRKLIKGTKRSEGKVK